MVFGALAAVFPSSSPGERLQTSSGGIKGEAFVMRARYEHPLEGEAAPGAGGPQSSPEMARNTGKREPTAGPLTRTRNRRAASATAGHRPASLSWQARARSASQGAEASGMEARRGETQARCAAQQPGPAAGRETHMNSALTACNQRLRFTRSMRILVSLYGE